MQKLLVCHTKLQQVLRFWINQLTTFVSTGLYVWFGFAILGLEASAHADVAALTELALRSIERSV